MNQHGEGSMVVIDEGDGTLQRRFDNGLCPFCECTWEPVEPNKCKYCNRMWIDSEDAAIEHQINKTGALE